MSYRPRGEEKPTLSTFGPEKVEQPAASGKGKFPALRGTVQDEARSQIGQVVLWDYEGNAPAEKAPVYTGNFETKDGKRYRIALWKAERRQR